MPAEKLTKNKLIQIIIMLVILLSAFIWRTITHINEEKNIVEKESTTENQTIDHKNNQSLQYKNSQ